MYHLFFKFLKIFLFLSVIFLTTLFSIEKAVAGTLLVTNVLSNSVSLLDEATLNPIREVSVGYMPHEVAVTPNGKFALVANFGDLAKVIAGSTVTVIDIANAKALGTIQLPKRSRPHGIKFISDREALVTAQGIQSLVLADIETGKVIKTLALPGAGAHMVVVDAEQRYAYVANTGSGSVCKVDLKSWSVVGEVKIGQQAEGITLTKDENLLLTTDSKDHYVAVIRTKDLTYVKNILTDRGPVRVVTIDETSAVVINSRGGSVQIIDLASLSVIKTMPSTVSQSFIYAPANILVKTDQNTAYVANFLANNVAYIDLKGGSVLKTFKTGYLPNGLAISPITAVSLKNEKVQEFRVGPIEINASTEKVWEVMINVENYYNLSKGAISAHADGEVAVGNRIKLKLYKDQWKGKLIPTSIENITVVDKDKKILGWQRDLPFSSGHTERYQFLESTADNKTLSTIVLRIPGVVGSVTNFAYKQLILDAFQALNEGIKVAAEQ